MGILALTYSSSCNVDTADKNSAAQTFIVNILGFPNLHILYWEHIWYAPIAFHYDIFCQASKKDAWATTVAS